MLSSRGRGRTRDHGVGVVAEFEAAIGVKDDRIGNEVRVVVAPEGSGDVVEADNESGDDAACTCDERED